MLLICAHVQKDIFDLHKILWYGVVLICGILKLLSMYILNIVAIGTKINRFVDLFCYNNWVCIFTLLILWYLFDLKTDLILCLIIPLTWYQVCFAREM